MEAFEERSDIGDLCGDVMMGKSRDTNYKTIIIIQMRVTWTKKEVELVRSDQILHRF